MHPPSDLKDLQVGGLIAINPTSERASDGSIVWSVKCQICSSLAKKSASDLKRGRGGCPVCVEQKAQDSPCLTIYNNYKRNARRLKRSFEISFEQFKGLVSASCSYCGDAPSSVLKKAGARYGIVYNGLDRVDNDRGYVLDNVVTACKFCNFAKSQWTLDEFLAWLKRIQK